MASTDAKNWTISSELITKEAKKRNLSVDIIDKDKNLYAIFNDDSKEPILFKASAVMANNMVGERIADEKDLVFKLIDKYLPNFSKPKSLTIKKGEDVSNIIDKESLKYPLVVKPLNCAHGDGVVVNIKSEDHLIESIRQAFEFKDNNAAIVQEMLDGDDYRILTVGYKVVAVSKRIPAFVIGNGKDSIKKLVEIENKHPMRGGGDHDKPLSQIIIDAETERLLGDNKMSIDSVPEEGVTVHLKRTANLSTGGVGVDYTDVIHPETSKLAERLSSLMGLNLAAVDIMAKDITKPLSGGNGGFIEMNVCPGLRMHHYPYEGKSRNVAKEIINLMIKER